jgi:hypothetical protein
MLRVIRNHRRAAYGESRGLGQVREPPHHPGADRSRADRATGGVPLANSEALLTHATKAWDDALTLGTKHGYRNAQTTVIAPTGTIGLLMDCDTTGVEPDFALVKFKKLAGGGYFKIANNSVRARAQGAGLRRRPDRRDHRVRARALISTSRCPRVTRRRPGHHRGDDLRRLVRAGARRRRPREDHRAAPGRVRAQVRVQRVGAGRRDAAAARHRRREGEGRLRVQRAQGARPDAACRSRSSTGASAGRRPSRARRTCATSTCRSSTVPTRAARSARGTSRPRGTSA